MAAKAVVTAIVDVPGGCTYCQAVALLAYGDEDVAAQFGAPPGVATDGADQLRHARGPYLDALPTLPGKAELIKLAVGPERQQGEAVWREQDRKKWDAAAIRLWSALKAGEAKATQVGDGTELPASRWTVRDPAKDGALFRISSIDIANLMGADPIAARGRVGRPPGTFKWFGERHRKLIMDDLDENGFPTPGDGRGAGMVDRLLDAFQGDEKPSQTTCKEFVKNIVAEYKMKVGAVD